MDYVSLEQARSSDGLRLVLTAGVPAPWSEAAKGVLRARGVEYLPVKQRGGEANEDLVDWTGHRNAPTAMYKDEPARVTAMEMINLAERLGSGPSLVPAAMDERVLMVGLLNEIAGDNGLAWNARTLMFQAMSQSMDEEAMAGNPMFREYHFCPSEAEAAPARAIEILQALSAQLRGQHELGSRYFVGDRLSALDIYWACFSQMLVALPPEVNPMPDFMRDVWGLLLRTVNGIGYEVDGILLEHRDYIFPKYLQWPLDF